MNRVRLTRVAPAIVAALCLGAFLPALSNGLVWDDTHLLIANTRYQDAGAVSWAFTTTLGGHYQPLTWLSYTLDFAIWGRLSPAGLHLTNLLLHTLTAILFFFVCCDLLGRAGLSGMGQELGALLAASFWAVHPLRVESVAWVTERRDVLSGVFLMAALLLYLRAVAGDHRNLKLLAFAIICYAASLLSKAAGITLPLVLVILDVYPLQRLRLSHPLDRSARVVWLEKLLFLIPSLVVAVVALAAQANSGALRSFTEHSIGLRISQAFFGIAFYFGKMIWPVTLIPLYEQDPTATPWEPEYLLAIAVVVGVTVVAWILRRRFPAVLAAWSLYIVLLLPVLGFAQSGPQIAADRYTYLSMMPLALLFGGGIASIVARRGAAIRRATTVACVALFVPLIVLTRAQVRIWHDSFTLWATVVERAPNTGLAQASLAIELNQKGEYERAREHALLALNKLPRNRSAHAALGAADLQLGLYEKARQHLEIALQIARDLGRHDTVTMARLAAASAALGDSELAEETYRELLHIEPNVAEWPFLYAGFLASESRLGEAEIQLKRALTIESSRPDISFRLAVLQRRQRRSAEAIETLETGIRHNPENYELRGELAWMLATAEDESLRDPQRAATIARKLLMNPMRGNARPAEALAAATATIGDFSEAVRAIEGVLQEDGELPQAARERLERELDAYRNKTLYHEP